MKIGISISIDVSKIEKARLYKGKKGVYLDLTTFIDLDNKDQYENNGFISQTVSKDERASGIQTPILGNCKVFFTDSNSSVPGQQHAQQNQPSQNLGSQQGAPADDFDIDSIPF